MHKSIGSKVHIVFVRAPRRPELVMLGIFDSMERANQFIDRVNTPYRSFLEIHTLPTNAPVPQDYWMASNP